MVELSSPYRRATPDDAVAMAKLANIAGEGMPHYFWQKLADEEGSTDAWEIGQDRAQRESGSFSFRNTVVREESSAVVAALIGYALPEVAEPSNYDDMPAMIVPLQQLEDLAPGTWYVNVLAAFEEHRGKGFGSGLLDLAEQIAVERGCSGMSLIVADANTGARRLYARSGFTEEASRPMIKEDWQNPSENWILLRKSF